MTHPEPWMDSYVGHQPYAVAPTTAMPGIEIILRCRVKLCRLLAAGRLSLGQRRQHGQSGRAVESGIAAHQGPRNNGVLLSRHSAIGSRDLVDEGAKSQLLQHGGRESVPRTGNSTTYHVHRQI